MTSWYSEFGNLIVEPRIDKMNLELKNEKR